MRPTRRHWGARVLAALAAGAGWGSGTQALAAADAQLPEEGQAQALQLWGYYPWWMREQWRAQDLSFYDRLKFFELAVDDEGRLPDRQGWPQQWEAWSSVMRKRGGAVDVTVTLFNAARFERVFTQADRRAQLLSQILEVARAADGVQLDVEIFETVTAPALQAYRAFCVALGAGLKRQGGKSLSVFGVVGAVVDLYDRATLALVDHVVVQGYDAHHAGSRRAGPVAPLRGPYPLTWESALQHYLAFGVPRRRILMSLPFYGYEWPTQSGEMGALATGAGRQTSYALIDAALLPNIRISAREQAATHGLRRDPVSGSPYYVLRTWTGAWRQGWFEDEISLAAKLNWARQQGLAGVAVFPVGYDAAAFDAVLQRSIKGK